MTRSTARQSAPQPLVALRAALLELKATGADGFEGLLAVVLGKIADRDFRLAKSGLQNGKDGETLVSASHISFEAKRYDTKINDNEVLTKIARLIASPAPPDLWILGATIGVSAQLLEPLQVAAVKNGIAILVLDWPATSALPPLAVACAAAPAETVAFLRENADKATANAAEAALAMVACSDGFTVAAAELARRLREPSLGGPNARQANAGWLNAAFSDRLKAKAAFGQVLAPGSAGALPTQARKALSEGIQDAITRSRSGEIVAVLGGEGRGKSWLIAQSWLSSTKPPLTIIIPAVEIQPVAAYGKTLGFIVSKFIEQTGDTDTDTVHRRWERQIGACPRRQDGECPRFVVCVDGLNERPDVDWARWLDGAAILVAQHGGVLLVTAREAYFKDRVRTALLSKVETIDVPEWSEAELQEILSTRGIDHRKLARPVFERLRNPRILGIAFDLLRNVDIEAFTELTVERLLFEHIRVGAREINAPEPADQFVKRLASHAQEIIERTRRQHHEDRLVFGQSAGEGQTYELTPDLLAVTAEHFFQRLPEEPTLYSLSDEGLSLALGLSIIKALQKAERNQRSIDEALGELLDPIAALDKTAEAVFSAALVASVDDRCTLAIRRALIAGLLRLQNLHARHYPAFVAVVRNVPDAAMWALYDLAVSDGRSGFGEWLVSALRECRGRPDCWVTMSAHLARWLGAYSTDPRLGVWRRRGDDEKAYDDDLAQRMTELDGSQQALSSGERDLLNSMMVLVDGVDPDALYRPAFELLAGMPLAPFAKGLVACAFAMSFNSSTGVPHNGFQSLVRFNRQDWSATRTAVLDAAECLLAEETSNTGQWALVYLLRALSTAADAAAEMLLVEQLTADREKFKGWRLVENYCSVDPCDPASVCPNDIRKTVEAYEQINVAEIHRHRSTTSESHFLEEALPAMARFAPLTAVRVHRAVATSVVDRPTSELELGIFALEDDASILDRPIVEKLKALIVEHTAPYERDSKESRDEWLIAQYAAVALMAHLDGDQQLDLFLALPPHGPPLLKLGELYKRGDPQKVERLLEAANEGDDGPKLLALSYVLNSDSELTERSRDLVAQLTNDKSSAVRAWAMAVVARRHDAKTIREVVHGGWSAAELHPKENYYEIWYGSRLIVCAAELGLLDEAEVLARISPMLYSLAATRLGAEVGRGVAARLQVLVETALGLRMPFRPPAVRQVISDESAERPPLYELTEPNEVLGAEAFFKRLAETAEEFGVRQRESWSSFARFEAEITKEKALLAIENVGFDAIDAFAEAAPEDAIAMATLMLQQDKDTLWAVQNFGLMLAKSITGCDPALGLRLFEHLAEGRACVSLTFGPSSISLEGICIWTSASSPDIDERRRQRLDSAASDYELNQEVLAALRQGHSSFLEAYAKTKLTSQQPAEIGRGLMVLGLGLESQFADETLAGFAKTGGLIGKAAEAARFAYDRNRWSRHWFELMCATDSAEEFWCLSVLFLKVVDGRFGLWSGAIVRSGSAVSRFGFSINDRLEKRISAWKAKREKTLLGEKAPSKIYFMSK